jgi:DNA-directed RNA polymerase subunit RPC12/RpoP
MKYLRASTKLENPYWVNPMIVEIKIKNIKTDKSIRCIGCMFRIIEKNKNRKMNANIRKITGRSLIYKVTLPILSTEYRFSDPSMGISK